MHANDCTIDAMTLNLMADGVTTAGFQPWPDRRCVCLKTLPEFAADIIALQECLPVQQRDVIGVFPNHDWSVSDLSGANEILRDAVSKRLGGEFPESGELLILYRRTAFELMDRKEAWLSPTPSRVSVGFGNIAPRSLLALRLLHRASGREFWVANAHLDIRCTEPMAKVAVDILASWIDATVPALWFGDFNAGLRTITADFVRQGGWVAPATTADDYRGERVDHIWHRGSNLQRVDTRVVDSEEYVPALSDHDPVLARFRFE
jgi:endonuclease/exonuclease/phosphatase family metal-dependent hydrolase